MTYNRSPAATAPGSHGVGNGNGCCRARRGAGGGFGWVAGTPAGGSAGRHAPATSVPSSSENCTALDCCPSIWDRSQTPIIVRKC